MKKLFFFSSLALTLCATTAMAQTGAPKTYGASFSKAEVVLSPGRSEWLLKDKQSAEKVQMSGYVTEVCQKEGCWLKMTTYKGTNDEILVKMKDHAFVLPKDIAGKKVIVNGTLIKKTQSVAEQQHYLEDAGASKEAIAAVTAPKDTYVFEATGVEVF